VGDAGGRGIQAHPRRPHGGGARRRGRIHDAHRRADRHGAGQLGGKAPVIVFDDADLKAVVEGVKVFGYYNAGQDCTAACRVYAGAKIYDI
jgi:acyl-CoA reductase-like NAD-dependent aldehyde dehydrogenase